MKTANVQDLSLFEFIIAIIIVLFLIFAIANMNLNKKSVIDEVNFEMTKQNFSQNISLMRAQWLIEGRPSELSFNFYADREVISNTVIFSMSEQGWPQTNNACRVFWIKTNNLDVNEDVAQYVTLDKSVKKTNDIECQFCDAGNNDSCIVYSSHYGMQTIQQAQSN